MSDLEATSEALVHPCRNTEDWVQVINFDMTDPAMNCPGGWAENKMFDLRTCGRTDNVGFSCYNSFPTAMSFSKVCGRVKAYAYGGVDGFESFIVHGQTQINQPYVTGVSLTSGADFSKHLWTFAAGIHELGEQRTEECPCDRANPADISVPDFVGNKYFCEAGINVFQFPTYVFQGTDPLWDGRNCNPASSCCEFNRPPYFINNLGKTITETGINARICLLDDGPVSEGDEGDDILVEQIEVYIAP